MKSVSFVVTWAVLLSACAGPGAADTAYLGEPIAVVTGSLLSNVQPQTTAPIHLALVWYSDLAGTHRAEKVIVTRDVAYQGTFPIRYDLPLYGPPPDAAIEDLAAQGAGRFTAGVLVAYEDLDGDGKLASIPPGGSAVDRILGSSVGLLESGPDPQGMMVSWLEGAAPAKTSGWTEGFNLMRYGELAALPLSTPVPIVLTGDPDLNLFVCEENFTANVDHPCGAGAP